MDMPLFDHVAKTYLAIIGMTESHTNRLIQEKNVGLQIHKSHIPGFA